MKIDGIECTEHGVPLDGFKVGDVVDWMGMSFEIDQIGEEQIGGFRHDAGGGYHSILVSRFASPYTRPSLRLVSRPRKLVEGWFNKTKDGLRGPHEDKGDAVFWAKPNDVQIYMRECDPPEAKES